MLGRVYALATGGGRRVNGAGLEGYEGLVRVGFYHLTRTTPDAALPELLGRTLAAGERAVVVCGSEARVAELDRALWASVSPDWLPHGTARTGHAALQPIWIMAGEAARVNGARYVFLLDGVELNAGGWEGWERVFDLFDGANDSAVVAARARWAVARAAGAVLSYWRQTASGWENGSG